MNNRIVGKKQEERAGKYLEAKGMKILQYNYQIRSGEIDIIGKYKGYLVFVEVKYRKTDSKGNGLEAVDFRKQRKICKIADHYRYTHNISADTAVRYDVIAMNDEKIEWIENAFLHVF